MTKTTKIEADLSYPIKTAAGEVSVLSMTRPNVGHLRRAEKDARADGGGDVAYMTHLIKHCAELSMAEVDQIDSTDLAGISQTLSGFLPAD